jgi:hypothetical protein
MSPVNSCVNFRKDRSKPNPKLVSCKRSKNGMFFAGKGDLLSIDFVVLDLALP